MNAPEKKDLLHLVECSQISDCAKDVIRILLERCPKCDNQAQPTCLPGTRLLRTPDGKVIRHNYGRAGSVFSKHREKFRRFLVCVDQDMTPAEIAEKIGVSRNTVYWWLRRMAGQERRKRRD